ncbi:MAG: mannose-1-phosphate guanylyltransferase [Deltaproteobacteria bacterium]|nr:MAG: mannose-1-phosphate guanylyltransferase [Deltaproteobacteria bacterium]
MSLTEVDAVILAGGSGTRFWPLSRRDRPKQLLALTGPRSLLAATAERVLPVTGPDHLWVVCGPAHAAAVGAEIPAMPEANLLVEPAARNTAAAVALACHHVGRRRPDAVVAILPADHHIAPVEAFRRRLLAAAQVAREGAIVTLGIEATRPATGYGWIRAGAPLGASDSPAPAFRVDRFIEKPDRETAERLLESGGHYWNAGIFIFRADVMRSELARHAPFVSEVLEPAFADESGLELERAFEQLPSISIDHAVMEKTDRAVVLPADFEWSDVGSFDALHEILDADEAGNVALGDAVFLDARGNVAAGEGTVAILGLDEIVVVRSGEVVLVCPRNRAQEVRDLVRRLEEEGREEIL